MSLNWIQTLVLALLQGITELFPISSLGHTVIIPGLLGWTTLVQSPQFLPLIVAFHLGTSIALVLYFWRDWWVLIRTLVQSVKQGEVKQGDASWVSWLVIIGCIPAGLLGVFLEKPLKHLFASPLIAAAFLVVNGSILLLGEALRHRARVSTQKGQERGRFPHPWNQLGLPADRRAELGLPSHSWVAESVAVSPSMQGPTMSRELSFRPLTSLCWRMRSSLGWLSLWRSYPVSHALE